jgi:hypothetical protein
MAHNPLPEKIFIETLMNAYIYGITMCGYLLTVCSNIISLRRCKIFSFLSVSSAIHWKFFPAVGIRLDEAKIGCVWPESSDATSMY